MNLIINDSIFDQYPSLESKSLIFREFSKEDSMDLFLIRSNELVMKFIDVPRHENIKDSGKLISSMISSFREKTGITWAITDKISHELIGYIGFWRLIREHCRAEIGFVLKPEFWGKGVMTEALERILDFGFNDLKIHSVEANVNPLNERSVRLLEKAGFKKEAWFRENFLFNNQFLDSFIFSMLETDFKSKKLNH